MSSLRYIFSSGASGRPYCRDENEGFRFRTKDNTCAVFEDSKLIYASESERFTKIKHDYSLPYQNLETFERYYLNSSNKKIETVQFDWTSHHDCHIFECFYQSGFNEAAVLVNDGCGNLDESITLAYMKQGETPVILKKFERENSLCGLYRFASDAVFNQISNCEGKFMGLAGYGKDNGSVYAEWDDKNKEIVVHKDLAVSDGKICMERATRPDDVMGSKDYAYSVQRDFEHVLVEVVKYFRELLDQNNFQTKNLCMSGGGVLNCPANSKIVDLGLFDNYYASPQPSDGCAESIGKFFKIMHENREIIKSKRLETAYLGLTYPIEMLPGKKEFIEQRIGYISEFLESGGVVAWYQEGAEYGPRALGHRSFLADPSKQQMLDDLNKIKGREAWRPLAPIVPEELFNRIFEVDNTDMCEFMLRTLKIKERWRERLVAVCHVDGTTRPQLLKRKVNPLLYDLIMTYFKKYHIPCLVNTSLNINGFPIVETPRDFSYLIEEIAYMKDVPKVMGVLTDKGDSYEVFPVETKVREEAFRNTPY